MPPLKAQGTPLKVFSNVHSHSFPAKSYIFILFVSSDAPAVNKTLLAGFVPVIVVQVIPLFVVVFALLLLIVLPTFL